MRSATLLIDWLPRALRLTRGFRVRSSAYRVKRETLSVTHLFVTSSAESLEDRTLLSAAATASQTSILPIVTTSPADQTAAPEGLTPTQIRNAYGFNQIQGDGSGQTIAIVDAYDDPNIAQDLQAFDAAFGIANPPSFTKLGQDGTTNLPGVAPPQLADWATEESLDVEWAHA